MSMQTNTRPNLSQAEPRKRTYEQTLQSIKQDVGGLETVRNRLSLSRKEICQLLMVDPSSWTRWTDEGGDAPPHIYRALAWYLEIESMKKVTSAEQGNDGNGDWHKDREIRRLKADIQSIRAQFAQITDQIIQPSAAVLAETAPITKNQGRSAWFWLLLGLLGVAGYWVVGMGR